MQAAGEERVDFRILPQLHNLEWLHATYVHHSFAKHMHDGYAIGVIERGALAFSYRGEHVVAPAGHINLVIPGEAHDGAAASDEGWTYRMFYLAPELLEQAVYEISGKTKKMPFFAAGTVQDDELACFIRRFHRQLETAALPFMEQESLLLTLLTEFIVRHGQERFVSRGIGKENQTVSRAREYIEDRYTQNISLKSLSEHCRLSPFHLIRVFKNDMGVPPHVYLKQIRIKRAKELLARGFSPAFAAQETGFTDQSHFSKQFKQVTGITPGKYSNIVQELSPQRIRME